MATYTIKTTDLLNGMVNGVPLPKVISANPKVPLKPGAVVNLPNQNTGTIPGLPSGAQGASGVSATGQGIPNVPLNLSTLMPGLPTIPTMPQQGFSIPAGFNTFLPSQSFSVPSGFNTQLPGGTSTPVSPADRLKAEYPTAPQPLSSYKYAGSRQQTPQAPAQNQAKGQTGTIPVVQNPIKPEDWAGYKKPPTGVRTPEQLGEYKEAVDSGLAKAVSDKWDRIMQQFSLGHYDLMEGFTPEELRFFQNFDKVDFDAYLMMLQQVKQPVNDESMNPGSGGGGGYYDEYYGGGGEYSSSYGSTYGLINWRI